MYLNRNTQLVSWLRISKIEDSERWLISSSSILSANQMTLTLFLIHAPIISQTVLSIVIMVHWHHYPDTQTSGAYRGTFTTNFGLLFHESILLVPVSVSLLTSCVMSNLNVHWTNHSLSNRQLLSKRHSTCGTYYTMHSTVLAITVLAPKCGVISLI